MSIKKRILLIAGGVIAAFLLACAGVWLQWRLTAPTGFSPSALLAEYDITVAGNSYTCGNAEMRQALADFVTDSEVAAYYEHRMPFWTQSTSWSPEEVVALTCYEGRSGKCDTAWLEANRGGTITVETWEDSDLISLKNDKFTANQRTAS